MFLFVVTRFLSGYFIAFKTSVWAVDIPGFGDLKDAVADGLGSWLDKLVDALTDTITDKYLWLLESTISLIGNIGMPPAEIFQTGPISILLGGTYGLALNGMRLVLVVTALILLINTARQRRLEGAGRVVLSVVGLAVFSVMFFPAYGFMDSLVRTGSQSVIELIAEAAGSEDLGDHVVPDDLFGAILTAGVGSIVMIFVLIEVAAMWIGTILVAIWYPMSIAIRPFLGRFGAVQFNVCTALLATIPVSLILMSFSLSFGILAVVILSALSPVESVPGATTLIGIIGTIVGALFAAATPIMLFRAAYAKSTRVFGNTESQIQSGIDVASMPTVSTQEVQKSQSHNRLALLSFVGGAAANSVLSDEPTSSEFKSQVSGKVDQLAMVGKAAPDPRVRAAAWAYDFARQYSQKRKDSNGGDSG